MVGSTCSHGDHAAHLWKSLTWAKTAAGGAAIVAVLLMPYWAGCMATTTTSTMTMAARPASTLISMETGLLFTDCPAPVSRTGKSFIDEGSRSAGPAEKYESAAGRRASKPSGENG